MQESMCSTCVFRPGNLMLLPAGRLAEIIRDNVANDSALPCHSTLYGQAEQEAVCRGFFDRHKTTPLQLAERLDLITFVTDNRRNTMTTTRTTEGCDLVGTEEIAAMLQVERRTVNVWKQRERLPEPYAVISGTPIWLRDDIVAWAEETGRLPS